MSNTSKLGLALSGGGFRATAFHLGVLKRLRELGVLGHVRVISTVSGGSIVGAFWAFWLATHPSALADDDEWSRFERRMVEIMRKNLRGRIVAFGALLPGLVGFALAMLVTGLLDTDLWVGQGRRLLTAGSGAVILGYFSWRLLSGRLLMHYYDKWLFDGAEMNALRSARASNKNAFLPELFINATALRSGRQILFGEAVRGIDALWEGAKRVPVMGAVLKWFERLATARPARADEIKRTIQLSTDFARAVTASSTVPGLFPPLRVGGPLDSALDMVAQKVAERHGAEKARRKLRGASLEFAVDGGVFDNQGTQALLEQDCSRIIISDAAAALRPEPKLSGRQVAVLKRSQDIIFERVRESGYRQLKLRHNIYRLVERVIAKRLDKETAARWRGECGPLVEGYCYIELLPARGFKFQRDIPSLPSQFHEAVASIRTDLDRFSDIELSALMYHGYTLIDHCLRGYNKRWIPNKNTEPYFQTDIQGIDIDWSSLTEKESARYANHLSESSSRIALWRFSKRATGDLALRLSSQAGWQRTTSLLVEGWKTVSPGWRKVTLEVTMTPEGGETVAMTPRYWKRRDWRSDLRRWLNRFYGRIRNFFAERLRSHQ